MQEEEVKKAVAEQQDENANTIILQVDMHCEGCKAKVKKAIKKLKGLELVEMNMQEQKVTIKGKLDPKITCETVKKKSGKRTILIYPDPKKLEEDQKKATEEDPKKVEAPPPPPPIPEVVIVLKVHMHCGACAKQIKRNILKMDGVKEVDEDLASSIVTVKGKGIDPNKLCERVKKSSGKRCEIVPPPPPPPPPPEEKKDEKPVEEKKEEEKKEGVEKPSEESTKGEDKPVAETPPAPEPEKKEDEKKEGDGQEKKEEKATDGKEEEKKEEKKEDKKEEPTPTTTPEDTTLEIKKYEYIPYSSVSNYVYPPQLFSDENPNACSIM